MKNLIFKSYAVLVLILASGFGAFAQIPQPQAAPIDGGITALVVAISAYVGKKLYDNKKDSK
ncbi:MAG: hypothetical protein IPH78_07145 [Bacteroidetes bacterium]|nr:hypothetical protein [Bacteroidota bacterium]MBK8658088.1 hypothetical protein [Bacteroidota bacterium]